MSAQIHASAALPPEEGLPVPTSFLALLATCFHAGLLLRIFFDPEDEDDIFLRNIGCFSTEYMALYLKR
jgi:hypothetical protein